MDSKTNFKDRLKSMSKSLFSRQDGRFLKATAAALLVTTLSYNFAFAKEETETTLEQIYHVYVGNKYMGAVESQETVEQLVAEKEEAASIRYKEFSVDAGSNIKLIPELVFTSAINTNETIDNIKDALVVEAIAQKVTVNGETVTYLKNEEDFEKVLNKLKLQYVSKSQLDDLNASQLSNESLPELKVGQTRIKEINIAEDIEATEVKVKPGKVLSVKEAVELLSSGSLEKVEYKVKQGDVLGSIASKHGLKLKELLELNPEINENSMLKIDQALNVTALKPYVTVEVVMEKLAHDEIDFDRVVEEDKTILKGETKVTQKGVKGKKEALYEIIEVNGERIKRNVITETVLTEPKDEITVKGTKVIPSRGTGVFSWPAQGGYISSTMGSRWGSFHRGIDIARPSGYTIKAADNGTVTFTGWDGSYGNKVVINHNNGFQTVYAHLSSINVSVGQVVSTGANLGKMGSTGRSTGTHLHFEVLKNGSHVNPLSYLK